MGTYKRVLLKLSGESLGGPAGKGIDENWLAAYAEEVAEAAGMSKPSAGQIEYVELGGPDKAVVYAAGKDGVLDKFFASVEDGVGTVVEYFR